MATLVARRLANEHESGITVEMAAQSRETLRTRLRTHIQRVDVGPWIEDMVSAEASEGSVHLDVPCTDPADRVQERRAGFKA